MNGNRLIWIFIVAVLVACSKRDEAKIIETYPLPTGIDPDVAARLTKRHETDSYIFYYARGDNIEFARCEAYAKWGMDYLGISLPKKIEYFKFRDWDEMGEALPSPAGGWAFPEEVAYATMWTWHNHECMHVLAHWWADGSIPPSFFLEGMAVAHEFDPYNNDWISRWNRAEIREPWIDIVKELYVEGKLYSISEILSSQSFWENIANEEERIGYPQAGMFIAYLIEKYGLEKTREIYVALDYDDSLETIKTQFKTIYDISVQQAEEEWLVWLANK